MLLVRRKATLILPDGGSQYGVLRSRPKCLMILEKFFKAHLKKGVFELDYGVLMAFSMAFCMAFCQKEAK